MLAQRFSLHDDAAAARYASTLMMRADAIICRAIFRCALAR